MLSIIEELKEKHGTPVQLHIWSESDEGGIHSCLEEPPAEPMFVRAGKGT